MADLPKPKRVKGRLRIPQVDVWWVDAASHTDDSGITPEPMLSVGFPIKYADDYITLAGEFHASGSNRDFTTIPRGMVKELTVARWVTVPDWVMEWIVAENARSER